MGNEHYASLGWGLPLPKNSGLDFTSMDDFPLDKFGLMLMTHYVDSDDGILNLLVMKESHQQASSSTQPTKPAATALIVKVEWRNQIKAFYEANGFAFTEPGWLLAVSWDQ